MYLVATTKGGQVARRQLNIVTSEEGIPPKVEKICEKTGKKPDQCKDGSVFDAQTGKCSNDREAVCADTDKLVDKPPP